MALSVAVVMAHPDDWEILVGGTLWILRQRACRIHLVVVCRGDMGSMTLDRDRIAAIRRREAEASAALLGATFACLNQDDLTLTYNAELKTRIASELRRARAQCVITHAPVDYMMDHEAVSLLAREACFSAPMPNWPAEGDPLPAIPEVYYADPLALADHGGQRVPAGYIVDVTAAMEKKVAMLACHDSQRSWLREQHGEDDYILSMKKWAQLRGSQAGCAFGEGLTLHRGHPFPQEGRMLELLT